MTLSESVRNFLRAYPPLSKSKVNVDYLASKIGTYSLEQIPIDAVERVYVDGSKACVYKCVLASREAYSEDKDVQLENLQWFEDLSNWISEQNLARNLPNIDDKNTANTIRVITSGCAYNQSGDTARYQMEIEVKYVKKI